MLDRSVHFLTPDGTDIEVPAGTYQVETAGETRLRLSPVAGGAALLIRAEQTTHTETVESPMALSVTMDEDITHVLLLMPDKTALDALGSATGIRSRADLSRVLTAKQINQAAEYQLLIPNPGAPPAPIPVSPQAGALMTTPSLRVQWQLASTAQTNTRYEICVSEQNQACSGPNAVVFKLSGTLVPDPTPAPRLGIGPRPGSPDFERQSGTSSGTPVYSHGMMLPFQFQGKRLQWSVVACVPNTSQATTFIGQTLELCTPSAPRPITWALPSPMLGSPADNTVLPIVIQPISNLPTLTQPSFAWAYGNQQGVEYFLVCVFKAGVPCPGQPTVQRYVVVALIQSALGFNLPQGVSAFMGQTLYWTVAACNAALGCSYQQQYRRLQVPIVDGSFDSIYEVTQNAKCKNCHQMHLENETYRRHVKLGRFTRDEIPPSAVDGVLREGGRLTETTKKCSNCHTSATGFTDEWRAPVRMFGLPGDDSFNQPIDGRLCDQFKAESPLKRGGQAHLLNDANILWAVGRIPGLGRARWQQKVDAWFSAGAPCGPRPRGQFTP